jgi:hypothetical protein
MLGPAELLAYRVPDEESNDGTGYSGANIAPRTIDVPRPEMQSHAEPDGTNSQDASDQSRNCLVHGLPYFPFTSASRISFR